MGGRTGVACAAILCALASCGNAGDSTSSTTEAPFAVTTSQGPASNTTETALTVATSQAPAESSWMELLQFIPDDGKTGVWLQLQKPQLAVTQLGFERPRPGAPASEWWDISGEVGMTYPGIDTLGMHVFRLGFLGTGHDPAEVPDSLFGADFADIDGAASAGRPAWPTFIGPYVVVAGTFEAEHVERWLGERFGAQVSRGTYKGMPTFEWPAPDPLALGIQPPYAALALVPGGIVLANTLDDVKLMVDAPDSDTALGDRPDLRLMVEALEAEGAFAANVLQLQGETLYDLAQQTIDEREARVPDEYPVRPLTAPEADDLRTQPYLVPYERLALGWTGPSDSEALRVGGVIVLLHAESAAAERNAEILPAIAADGASAFIGAPWSDSITGLTARSEGKLAVATMRALPRWSARVLFEAESFFASRPEH